MMGNGVNQNLNGTDPIAVIMESENFVNLDPNLQNKIIDTVYSDKEKDGGAMGKFLANKPANASVNIGFVVCVILIAVLVIDIVHSYCVSESINMDLVKTVVPVITLSMGYIFGKGSH